MGKAYKIRNPRLCIIGHGRHGKDALAEILNQEYGWTFCSSSMKAAEIFLFDKLKDKYGYKTFEECYEDRHNHRAEWHQHIIEYNKDDKVRLAKEIMKSSDIYVGMRDKDEIIECIKQGVFDLVLWVHRPGTAYEGRDSFNIDMGDASLVVLNDGTLEDLKEKASHFANQWVINQLFNQSWMDPVEASIKVAEMNHVITE